MNLFLLLLQIAISQSSFAADAKSFTCKNYYPPAEQGKERFARIDFFEDGSAKFEIADFSSPFWNPTESVNFSRGHYSHKDSTAFLSFKNATGREALLVSMVYFGSWWGAVIQAYEDFPSAPFSLKAGAEIEMRCIEKD